jgi:hypothetical protein
MAVLRGAKVFKLYDPTQSTLLYAGTPLIEARFEAERRSGKFVIKDRSASAISSRYEKPIRLSPYSPLNISEYYRERSGSTRSRFPRFAAAMPTHCRAEAGDLLFIPSRWWHEVTSEGDVEDDKTIAINYWFKPWYHHLGFNEQSSKLIRNEHYSHLTGEFKSAEPCKEDERLVCWITKEESNEEVRLDPRFLKHALRELEL